MLSPSYSVLKFLRLKGKEVAYYEPPHQGLRCLQMKLDSSLIVEELMGLELSRTDIVFAFSSVVANIFTTFRQGQFRDNFLHFSIKSGPCDSTQDPQNSFFIEIRK